VVVFDIDYLIVKKKTETITNCKIVCFPPAVICNANENLQIGNSLQTTT
jgi:hypothetical protein